MKLDIFVLKMRVKRLLLWFECGGLKVDNVIKTNTLNNFTHFRKKYMLRFKTIIFLYCLFQISLVEAAATIYPKNIQLEYEVSRNGKLFGHVKETFTQNGKQYRIKSVTKGVGVYALMGERVLTSNGEVTKAGLKPSHFELHQGKSAKKTLIADFVWTKNTLNMQVKGETRTEKLMAGTQDLASYAYQFMFNPPLKEEVNVTLTTGKRLNTYRYKVLAKGEKFAVGKSNYKTIHISNEATGGEDKKELWLAEDKYYLPMRYILTDEDGDSFQQTLTKIYVE
jgi:Protein of unknown function (DUF3108)